MRRRVARRAAVLTVAAAVAALATLVGCTEATGGPGGTSGSAATGSTPGASGATPAATTSAVAPLVVEMVFDHATLDPTRQFDRSGLLVSRATYQTLTTLDPDDPTKVVPGLAEYTISPEGKWLTMRLRKGATFSDGSAITTDDVVFTLERAQGLRGIAWNLLGVVNIVKVDDRTFTLSSPGANFALPAILANPAFGILNSQAVKANGGTIGPGDTAARYLSTHSAGSGPYVIARAKGPEITLAANPSWTGAKPAFPEVVLRDTTPKQQLADLRAGRADIALDISPAQAQDLVTAPQATPLTVTASDSSTLAYLALNHNPRVNRWTANPAFVEAVRKGLDVAAIARAAGDAHPAAGLIPPGIVGSLQDGAVPTPPPTVTPAAPDATGTPTPSTTRASSATSAGTPAASATPTFPPPTPVPTAAPRDLAAAKAALKRSGYRGQPVPLTYAVDVPIVGIPRSAIAATVRAQLAQVGIKVVLDPQPASKALTTFRAGRSAFSLWSWSPDYPDPANYLAFAPGELVGKRAGWQLGDDPVVDDLTEAARASVGDDRSGAYAAWQVAMNERGPFVPLMQPMTHFASGSRVHTLPGNPVWTVDLAAIG